LVRLMASYTASDSNMSQMLGSWLVHR